MRLRNRRPGRAIDRQRYRFGLAGDPRLAATARAALDAGTGVGASRLTVGNHREHMLLEEAVADGCVARASACSTPGIAANVGVLTALLRAGDVVFSDELDHAASSMAVGSRGPIHGAERSPGALDVDAPRG